MQYISTRGQAKSLNFEQAATSGLAGDGGLYLPESWPTLSSNELLELRGLNYSELACRLVTLFTGNSVSQANLSQIFQLAYESFDDSEVAPLNEISNGISMLELYHGPTLSFKDYALQFLGRFMDWSLHKHNEHLTIVGATSGDTGSAAIHAVSGLSTIDLYMLHPHNRVSKIQRIQMTTDTADNIHNIAVDGTFDDCQAMVKQLFADDELCSTRNLGAVNSINWGRVAAQVVYYFHAAIKLGAPERPVSFFVPTGNFGNAFAAYAATKMGLPIRSITICSNENDILTRFFETGTMEKQQVRATLSPSMDIQVSSNFERFLFEMVDRNDEVIRNKMLEFANTGQFSVDDSVLERARSHFRANRVSDDETRRTILQHYRSTQRIVDPHTATALASAKMFEAQADEHLVVVATAHPAKFQDTIEKTIGCPAQTPERLAQVLDRREHYTHIAKDLQVLKEIILN